MNAKLVIAATIALAAPAAVAACVLADPPPIVTPSPQEAPHIIRESVSPPPDQILTTSPPCTNSTTDCFVVPVSVDLNASITYRVFVDLDPNGSGAQLPGGPSGTDDGGVLAVPPDAGPGIRTFAFGLSQDLSFDPTVCHVISFIVAYAFYPDDFSRPIDPPGGDRIDWNYQPTNDCSFYDAGAMPEAGTD